jgi:hypothetical protein
MNTIFKTEKDKKEFVAAFRKMTMSGAVTRDQAIEKLIRNNPNYFHQPPTDDIVKIAQPTMNDAIRERARQSNKISIDFFANVPPTDKKPL